jgi:RNA polymerase sigma-70 factor (ECF subfamily)
MELIAASVGTRVTADFDSFYEAEYPNVYRAARAWTGEEQSALDATQEAFARAFARWRRLRDEEWRGGWVMTTALNICRKKPARAVGGTIPKQEGDPYERVDITAALQKLSERQRTAAVLFYIGDLPLGAVAQLMDLSEGAVKSHLNRARQSMRSYLEVEDE